MLVRTLVSLLCLAACLELACATAADPEPKGKNDAEVKKLLLERRGVLQTALQARRKEFESGRATIESTLTIARKLLGANLDLAVKPAERISAHEEYYRLAVAIDESMTARRAAARASAVDQLLARAERLKAEVELRRAGGKPPPGIKPAGAAGGG